MKQKIKTLSLFSGSGAFERAFINVNYELEMIAISEIKMHSVIVYEAIFGKTKNLGDIREIDCSELSNIDLLFHGSPCQSFSKEGKLEGAAQGSNTKSSLLWETVRIISHKLPEVVIWENVANAKTFEVYQQYIKTLENLGYTNNEFLLNAKAFGIPQHRRRIVIVSTRRAYEFEKLKTKERESLSSFLDNSSNELIYYDDKYRLTLPLYNQNKVLVRNATKLGYISCDPGTIIDLSFPNSKTRRARAIKDRSCPTILTKYSLGVIMEDLKIRYLKSSENWLLMGRSREEYQKAYRSLSDHGYRNIEAKLYEIGGNSIVPQIIEPIAEQLKQYFRDYERINLSKNRTKKKRGEHI